MNDCIKSLSLLRIPNRSQRKRPRRETLLKALLSSNYTSTRAFLLSSISLAQKYMHMGLECGRKLGQIYLIFICVRRALIQSWYSWTSAISAHLFLCVADCSCCAYARGIVSDKAIRCFTANLVLITHTHHQERTDCVTSRLHQILPSEISTYTLAHIYLSAQIETLRDESAANWYLVVAEKGSYVIRPQRTNLYWRRRRRSLFLHLEGVAVSHYLYVNICIICTAVGQFRAGNVATGANEKYELKEAQIDV